MFVARPSPRPSVIDMVSGVPEGVGEGARAVGSKNISKPVYHSLQASVPAVPRYRSNPSLLDARTLFPKVHFPTSFARCESHPGFPHALPLKFGRWTVRKDSSLPDSS